MAEQLGFAGSDSHPSKMYDYSSPCLVFMFVVGVPSGCALLPSTECSECATIIEHVGTSDECE